MAQTIEEALFSHWSADAAVTALLGTSPTRIYPGQAPQDVELPCVIYQEASQQTVQALANVVNLNRYGLHLDIYGDSYAGTKAARAALKASVQRHRGTIGDGTLTVRNCMDETSDDGVESPIHADELGTYRAGLDLTLSYGTTT